LPAAPPVGVLVARLWRGIGKGSRRPDWLAAAFTVMIGLGMLVAASPQLIRVSRWQAFARHKIPPNVLPLVRPELFFTGLILVAIGILGRSLAQRLGTARAARAEVTLAACFVLLAATVPLLLVRWSVPLRGYAEANSSKQLGREILASPQST